MCKIFYQRQLVYYKSKFNLCCINKFLHFSFYIFKIWGLFPWKIEDFCLFQTGVPSHRDLYQLSKSYYGSFYNIFLMFVVTCIHLSLSSSIYILLLDNNAITTRAVRTNLVAFGYFTSMSILIFFTVQQKTMVKAIDRLLVIDKILGTCKGFISEKNNWPYVLFFVNLLILIGLIIFQTIILSIIIFITWSISFMFCNGVLIQYTMVLNALTYRVKCINKYILKLGRISTDLEFHSIFLIKLPIGRSIIPEIINIRYVYSELHSVCNQIANFYALPILFAIMYLSSSITYGLYFIFLARLRNDKYSPIEHVSDISWYFLIFYDLLTLAVQVNAIKKEINITVDNIHWVLNLCTISEDTENELVEFSKDLLKKEAPFKIYQVMALDGSLLYVIISAIVSDLIILLQFRLSF